MRHLLFNRTAPLSGTAKSIVVFLHGYGADGSDLIGLADHLAPHLPDTVFLSPDAPEPAIGGYGLQWFQIPWMDGTEEAALQGLARTTESLNGFLDDRLELEEVPASAMALFGFSQGAMVAMHVAPRRAERIAGVVAVAGRLLSPEKLAAEAISRPPVLLIHGDRDQVVPFDDMALAGKALVAGGFETYGHVMKDAAHEIAPDGLGAALQFLRDRLRPAS